MVIMFTTYTWNLTSLSYLSNTFLGSNTILTPITLSCPTSGIIIMNLHVIYLKRYVLDATLVLDSLSVQFTIVLLGCFPIWQELHSVQLYYIDLPYSFFFLSVSQLTVLPRFEVTLKAPEQLERTDDKIEVVVNAVYVFGENVQGSVKINATLESSGRRESLAFFDKTSSLVGCSQRLSI